jgi:hypothetical protein
LPGLLRKDADLLFVSDRLGVLGEYLAVLHGLLLGQSAHEGRVHLARVLWLWHRARGKSCLALHQVPVGRPRLQLAQGGVLVPDEDGVLPLGGTLLELGWRQLLLHHLPDLVLLGLVCLVHEPHGNLVDLVPVLLGQPAQGIDLKNGLWPPLLRCCHLELILALLVRSVLEHAGAGHSHAHLLLLVRHAGNSLHLVLHGLEPWMAPLGHLAHHQLLVLALLLLGGLQLSLSRGVVGELVLEIWDETLASFDHLGGLAGHGVIVGLLFLFFKVSTNLGNLNKTWNKMFANLVGRL